MTEQPMDVRERIMRATAELLARGGRQEVSTRAVSAAAGVQAPTIYRQFGDMRGLLDAVAHETFANYVRQKATRERSDDSIEDLRRGWDLHVAFGLDNPAVYALIYGDPGNGVNASASREAEGMLHELMARVAAAGQLRVSVPHAARMVAAAAKGTTLSLVATSPEARDPKLSVAMREAVIRAITIAPPPDGTSREAAGPARVVAHAVALRAVLAETPGVLTEAEQRLLREWLDRLADSHADDGSTAGMRTPDQ